MSPISVTHKEADWYRNGLETRDEVYKLVGNPEVRSMLDTVFHELSMLLPWQ